MSGYAIRSAYAVAPKARLFSPAPQYDEIVRLQEELLKLPKAECKTEHRFCDGMYLREYNQDPNVVVVSKIHKRENFFIVTKGRALVAEDGAITEVKAGDIIVTKPGTKRAVLTEDEGVTILTVHRVGKERDLNKIEKRLITSEKGAAADAWNHIKPGFLKMGEPSWPGIS